MRSGLHRIALIVSILVLSLVSNAHGAGGKDVLLSLIRPGDVSQKIVIEESNLEKLLAEPLTKAVEFKIPYSADYSGLEKDADIASLREQLFPGRETFELLTKNRKQLASLRPIKMSFRKEFANLNDNHLLESAGKLVSAPVDLYNDFIIYVNIKTYTVQLYAYRNEAAKKLLYECKAGLGSPEFPTPRGSYYVLTIFDHKPLWIPPAQREWAYGQRPSRSVYGGHMLPFFRKKAQKDKEDDLIVDLDNIAPKFAMVDTETYRIHGTDSPWSVGSAQSHGCVRLLNRTIKELANTLKMYVGTTTRGETENGTFISLAKPVKLVLF